MFYEIGFPNLSLGDWQKFRQKHSPYLFENVIDRHEACLPLWFVPLARGVAIASDYLLRRAGCHCGTFRPTGWYESGPGYSRKELSENSFLATWNCEQTGLWTVERIDGSRKIDEVLVYSLGRTPVLTRSYQAAMQLAMHCHVNGPPIGFRWLKADPNKDIEAIEIARRRQIEEAQLLP